MKKLKYEKPESLNAGQIASIQGAFCGHGSFASDGCTTGHDPNLQSVCLPSGSYASNNCESGDHAVKTCESGHTPGGDYNCKVGTSALGCVSGTSATFGGS